MARSEARISVSIWTDADFIALSPGAQRQFFFLLSQADVNHVGIIALRERRWSRSAAGLTAAQVGLELKELEAGGFVVIDPDTEELLVRSYVRRDGVYRQPNVLRSACSQIPLVSSTRIRAVLRTELDRLTGEPMPEGSRAILAEMLEALDEGSGNPPPNPSRKGSADPSSDPPVKGSANPSANPTRETSAHSPGDRGVVTVSTTDSPVPVPPDVPPPAGTAKPRRATEKLNQADNPTVGLIVSEWIENCRKRPPGQTVARVGRSVKAMLAEGIDAADIRRGLGHWMSRGLDPSLLPSVVNEVMNSSPKISPTMLAASTAPTPIAPDEVCPEHRGQRKGRCKYCRAAEIGVDQP